MSRIDELKPCPFCGNKNLIVADYPKPPSYWSIRCERCGCQIGDQGTLEAAIEQWNHRPIEEYRERMENAKKEGADYYWAGHPTHSARYKPKENK